MSNETRELNQHIDWLKDQLDWLGHIETQLDEIKGDVGSVHERLDDIGDVVNKLIDKINEFANLQNKVVAKIDELVGVQNNAAMAFNNSVAFQQILRNGQTVEELLRNAPKHPKQQKFKPKVVNNDQPDEPGAA